MTYVTLEYDGVEQSLADWGFELASARAESLNMRPNTCDLFLPGASYADTPIIPFEGKVIVRVNRTYNDISEDYSGGAIDFVGWRQDFTLTDEPASAGVNYHFEGGWYLLEKTMFQQPTAYYTGSVGLQNQTGLLLFSKISEGHATDAREDVGQASGYLIPIDNGWQIEQIFKFVIALETTRTGSAPFQIGTIDCDVPKPYYPAQELSCAAAIEVCLDLSPDCTVIWDDTTTPPTVSVRKKSNLTPVTLAVANGTDHQSLKITPLDSLVPRSVVILYRINSVVDGQNYVQFVKDKYGPHGANSSSDPDAGVRVILQTIDLQGTQVTTVSENGLEVIPCNCNYGTGAHGAGDAERRAFWATFHREFKSTKVRFQEVTFDSDGLIDSVTPVVIPNATIKHVATDGTETSVSLSTYPNVLRKGTIHPWMKLADGTPVVAIRAVIETDVQFSVWLEDAADPSNPDAGDSVILVDHVKSRKISADVTLTNATSGDYSTVASWVSGEDVPEGIAQALYEALSATQYVGQRIHVEQMITQQIGMANTLNLSGGNSAWTTMNAQIQGIARNYGTGQTYVTIGPARHLRGGDLNAVFQFNRWRRIWQNPLVRENAQANNGGANVEL